MKEKNLSTPRVTSNGYFFLFALTLFGLAAPARAQSFEFDDVAKRAQQLASSSYKKRGDIPKELRNLTYDQYRDLRFKNEKRLWRGTEIPFEAAFFHLGFQYEQPVKINEIVDGRVREFKYDISQFDYGANKLDASKWRNLGFAGLRVHYPLNTQKYKDEALVFHGVSYFRALGKGQQYGLSARGLAVDTGLNSGEEFPSFVEFWLQRPAPEAEELVIYGLLDSPRVTGAYRFVLHPGVSTAVDVKARLFLRDNIGKLGIAPLTSMFYFGENQPADYTDYRPEVHDSDGLSVNMGNGEWLWRPLLNPKRLLVTSFATTNPLGFGLMQRDREFSHYEDLESRYELRPSAWVEPKGQWGSGRIELVQLPAPDETVDNVVAYWVPDNLPTKQKSYDVEYRVLWQKENPTRPPHSRVVQTRRGHGWDAKKVGNNIIAMHVDFEGQALRKLSPEAVVEAIVTTDSNAEVQENVAYRNPVTGGWRLSLKFRRLDDGKPIELRAFLREGNNTLSETWSYVLPPS